MTNNVLTVFCKQKGHTMEPLFYSVIKVQKPLNAVYTHYNNTNALFTFECMYYL